MVLMNGIRQMVMIAVHGTGRLKYTCYRVFPFLNKKLFYFLKKFKHSVYRESKKRSFFAAPIKCNIDEM